MLYVFVLLFHGIMYISQNLQLPVECLDNYWKCINEIDILKSVVNIEL